MAGNPDTGESAAGKPAFSELVACLRAGDTAGFEDTIARLTGDMSLREKVAQMCGQMLPHELAITPIRYNYKPFRSGRNRRLGIPPILFTDGPRGVTVGHCTCFPVSMARGASWDPDLEERVANAMGVEARSQGANFSGAVCINVPRHPGWGRAQETFGEDPHLLGVMGAAMVRGLQNHVMACVKHYACNSIEEARFYVNVQIDERTLREIYLPHFKRCVDEGASSVMSAYNKVNGEFCGHNRHLLRDILKGEWEFPGTVMSDFLRGVRKATPGANGGLDIEMPLAWHYGGRLAHAVKRGRVDAALIDEAVGRILREKARFALVGEPSLYGRSAVACRDHTELALEAARKGIVLLKNENGALPLDRKQVRTVAVLGRLARKKNIGDRGSSKVRPPYVVTALEGLKAAAGEVRIAAYTGRKLSRAKEVAGAADAAVVFVGLTRRDEGEAMPVIKLGGDREDLDLSRRDMNLIKAVAEASDRCIVVVEGGSAVTMETWKDGVDAILMAWYPGMEGGRAIAELIFGDVNPSGKLTVTFPAVVAQLPPFDRKAREIEYGYFHGYRLFDREGTEPAFAFGHGLSYTSFEYGNLRVTPGRVAPDGDVEVMVDVTNIGEVTGAEVVQLYVSCPGKEVERAKKELKGFSRIELGSGETRTVTMRVPATDLSWYDAETGGWRIEQGEHTVMVGPSSRDEDLGLAAKFTVD